ncbi:hypothetical protein FQN55_003195 [Onygenales sp. PD_40]|nr:hypothetical protein FQN55_003195 [Onygenales sp. PD_40]KAK2791582.1 hypothetical protein FQN52_004773 [Onygenales sp. PD_12]
MRRFWIVAQFETDKVPRAGGLLISGFDRFVNAWEKDKYGRPSMAEPFVGLGSSLLSWNWVIAFGKRSGDESAEHLILDKYPFRSNKSSEEDERDAVGDVFLECIATIRYGMKGANDKLPGFIYKFPDLQDRR